MKHESPFVNIRFEHDGSHLYFLPQHLLRVLESQRPTYVVGTRGTGKTTLLQSLHWKERLQNQHLRQQLPNDPFSKRYIGVYLKLPWIQMGSLSAWVAGLSEGARGPITGLYLDLAWLGLLCDAVSGLIAEDVVNCSPGDEHKAVAALLKAVPQIRNYLFGRPPFTIADIGDAFGLMRRAMEDCARGLADAPPMLSNLPLGQVGELGRQAGGALAAACNARLPARGRKWHFKICMDEAECLDEFQELVLNTIVRLAEWPIFPIVSSVRLPANPTTTLISGLGLQKADRELIPLDDISDKEFRHLVEGIVTVRVQAILSRKDASFVVQQTLGSLDLNGLLHAILRESTSPFAKELLRRAQEIGAASNGRASERGETAAPPIYQAYLIERLHLPWRTQNQESWQRRKLDSSDFRKRMVAAFLSICAELNTRVPYASADMVLQMSDKCVRDFLSQMQFVFLRANLPLRTFLRKTIPANAQTRALWEASERKRDILQSQVAKSPTETERIVDGLAKVTAHIQSHGTGLRHLLSNEPGRFLVTIPTADDPNGAAGQVLDLVREATEAGYLRVVRSGNAEIEFQVHTSLAAAYGFSYRGAYYVTPLSVEDLATIRGLPKDEQDFDDAVRALGERIAGRGTPSDGPTLFGS